MAIKEAMKLPPPDFQSNEKPNMAPALGPASQSHTAEGPSPVSSTAPKKAKAQATPGLDSLDYDSWLNLVGEAAVYPWRNHGWIILVFGGFMAMAVTISSIGIFGLFSLVLIGCYFAAHYFNVIETTITGKMSQPEWPDLSNVWHEVVGPGLQVLVLATVSLAPTIGLNVLAERGSWPPSTAFLASLIGLAFHTLYFPLAIIALALHGSLFAGFPQNILPAIIRCSPGYWIGALCLWLTSIFLQWVIDLSFAMPYIGWLLGFTTIFYSLIVHGRFCGLLYHRFESRIGW